MSYRIQIGLLVAGACCALLSLAFSANTVVSYNSLGAAILRTLLTCPAWGMSNPFATKTYTTTRTLPTTVPVVTSDYSLVYTSRATTKTGLFTTYVVSDGFHYYTDWYTYTTLDYTHLPTAFTTTGLCHGSMCYRRRDAPQGETHHAPAPTRSETDTPASLPTPGPLVPKDYYHTPHPVHNDVSNLVQLDKRRRGGGGGSGGGGIDVPKVDPIMIPIVATAVWTGLCLLLILVHLLMSWRKPTSTYVTVKNDMIVLTLLILSGFAIMVSSAAVSYSPVVPPKYHSPQGRQNVAGHVFGWFLLVILIGLMLFELFTVRKRHPGVGNMNKSIKMLSVEANPPPGQVQAASNSDDLKPGLTTPSTPYAAGSVPYSGSAVPPVSPQSPPPEIPPGAPPGQWVYQPHPIGAQLTGSSQPYSAPGSPPPGDMYYAQQGPMVPQHSGQYQPYHNTNSSPPLGNVNQGLGASYYGQPQPASPPPGAQYQASGSGAPYGGQYGASMNQPGQQTPVTMSPQQV